MVPNVWVAFDVPKLPEREPWLIWLEGTGSNGILEIVSEKTAGARGSQRVYELLGVPDYWQFDPTGGSLDPILKGRELGPNCKSRDLVLKRHDSALCHSSPPGRDLCLEATPL